MSDTHVIEFLTAQELTKILKVKLETVRYWTAMGCPVVKLGRLRRFRLNELLAWLEKREEQKAA